MYKKVLKKLNSWLSHPHCSVEGAADIGLQHPWTGSYPWGGDCPEWLGTGVQWIHKGPGWGEDWSPKAPGPLPAVAATSPPPWLPPPHGWVPPHRQREKLALQARTGNTASGHCGPFLPSRLSDFPCTHCSCSNGWQSGPYQTHLLHCGQY